MATITISDLYQIIGAKEAYIAQLQKEIAELQRALTLATQPKNEDKVAVANAGR